VSEAKSAFGDESVFLERYISAPKHIEIQVLADNFGHTIHLFERECSVQRRHQKVVEEAPSAVVDAALRERMGKCAVDVARSCNYTGAGTVEFILDEQMNFYFLEMNTRLQVEHPITEMITGLDLVKEQIKIARGETLSIKQSDLQIHGHAIEPRMYAPDPLHTCLPDTGMLTTSELPQGPGVRVDDAFRAGMEVPVFYGPMIAKLIAWGNSREEAIERMKRAIEEYRITGIQSTLDFGTFVMNHPDFRSGKYSTNFINSFQPDAQPAIPNSEAQVAAILAYKILTKSVPSISDAAEHSQTQGQRRSNWKKNRI